MIWPELCPPLVTIITVSPIWTCPTPPYDEKNSPQWFEFFKIKIPYLLVGEKRVYLNFVSNSDN